MSVKRHEVKIGMELEGQCATSKDWYPVKVLRPSSNSPDLFWVRTTYPDRTTAEELLHLTELRKPRQERPMDEHAQLLADARGLARKADAASEGFTAYTFRTLADTVAHQDTVIDEMQGVASRQGTEREARIREREKRTAVLEDRLDGYLAERSNVIAELRAACETCDEAICNYLMIKPALVTEVTRPLWEAASRAGRAAKLGKPVEDVDEQRLAEVKAKMAGHAVAQIESGDDDFMGVDTFRATEQRIDERLDGFDDALGLLDCEFTAVKKKLAKLEDDDVNATLAEATAKHAAPPLYEPITDEPPEVTIRRMRDGAPPPVEVEMRCGGHIGGGWTWECCWSGIWFAPLHDDLQHALTQESCARGAATRWLAALSKQLGVPLVADWKEGERWQSTKHGRS